MKKTRINGLLLLAGMCVALGAKAQSTDTWVGGSGNNFSTLANWNYTAGSGPVAAGDFLVFDVVGSVTPNNDLAALSFPNITFNGGAPSFTISGNPFTLGTAGQIITVNSTSAQTINNNIALGNVAQSLGLNSGSLVLGGVISGGGNTLTVDGGQNLTLNGASTYAGTTLINSGTVFIGTGTTAFGASRVNLASGPTIDLSGHNLSLAFINNSAALTGGVVDNVSAGGNVTLKVGSGVGGASGASGTYTSVDSFSGIIKNTTGTVGLTKVTGPGQTVGIMSTASLPNGTGMLRLTMANSYTGPTTVNGGLLELNFGNSTNGGPVIANNIISPSSALVMAGGDLIVDTPLTTGLGAAQVFSSLTLNVGASHLASYRPSSGSASLTFNGITRNTGSTVDFQSRPSGSSSNQKIGAADGSDNTTNVNANFSGGQQTILGGYATFNTYVSGGGGGWAVTANNTANASKAINALGTYNAGFLAAKDVDAAIGTSTPAAMTINSLRFNTAGAYTVNSSGDIVIATGGILETLTVGANAVAINNNNLTSGNGQDLIVHQYNTGGAMTIAANVIDNGGAIGLTKSGPGALTLAPNSANTFSGQLTLNAGTTTLGNANALNGVPAVVFGGMSQTLGGAGPGFTYANGTLNLNGNSVSVASLTAGTESAGTALVQNASATPATLTVNGTATKSFTGTLQDGTGGGALSLVKNGSGSQTLGGTLSYSGTTTVSAGTLALTATPSATTLYAVNGTLDVTGLGSSTLALISGQTLAGSGTVSGNVSVASNAHTRPGAIGVTNTITGNLTYATGAKADFDLNTSATTGFNDQIILSGASSVLNCAGVQININLMGAGLDTTTDYVLFKLTGGSASITNTFNAVPNWLGTVPANSGSYSIVTDTVNKKVLLHFSHSTAPVVSGGASPATVVRNQSTFISVTNVPGSGTITNVYLDLTLIGGSPVVPLTLSSTANVYTNTIIIPAAAPVGSTHVVANAMDTTPLTGSANIALNILATSEVWNGNDADDNWSSNLNWVSTLAPGLVGDALTFDGSTRLTPVMNNSYTVTALTFPATASSFNISSGGGTLTLAGTLVNNSANAQTLNVPVSITGTQAVNTAAGDVTVSGAITGGGLNKSGVGTLFLSSGANTYTGNTTISNGAVSILQNASIGGGSITLAGGALTSGYASGTRLTLANTINVPAGNTGTINMSGLNRLNGTVTGSGILNINAPGGQDDIGGGWNTYAGQINIFGGGTFRLVINGGSFNGFSAAAVTLTNVFLAVSDNSGGNTFGVGAFNVDATATISGPYQGNSPNFVIGGLNQNDLIAGAVQGNTRITKVGTGNLTITSAGTATYTGQTIVSNGVLTVLGAISSSPVTNYSGATITGTGTYGAAVDLEAGSSMTPVIGGYGILTCSSDLTFNGGTNVVHISTTNIDLITVGGNLSLTGGGVRLVIGNTLTNGVYKLMTYAGTLNGAAGNLSLAGFSQSGQTAVLSDATAGEIDLIVAPSGGASLTWASTGAQNNIWDLVNSINWNNGATLTTFSPADHVTFNNAGAGNTTVDVRAIVQPSTTVVTGSQAYLFQSTTGGGKLSGATNSLALSGTGSLELDILSDYGGPTTIGNGSTLIVGNGSGAASIGTGLITDNGALVFNQTNNIALTNIVGTGAGTLTKNGTGTLTLTANNTYNWTTIGSGATLQVGTGGATGSLGSGSVTNDGKLVYNKTGAFSVGNINTGPANGGEVDFTGTANVTLNNGNTYINNTVVSGGVVKLSASEVIPSAATVPSSTGWLVLDGGATAAGTLDLGGFNQSVNALSGLGSTVNGLITNSAAATATTNTLTVLGSAATTYAGNIAENSTGSKIALVVHGANQLELRNANTYSGGTIVSDTATLALHNSAAAGTGGILMNNGTTLRMNGAGSGGDPSVFPGNAVTLASGATVTFTSQQTANGFGITVTGDATTTAVIGAGTSDTISFSSSALKQFQGMLGTVLIPSGSTLRWSANSTGDGGDSTPFDVEGTMTSKLGAVSLGALTGSGIIDGGGTAGNIVYTIGLKNTDTAFPGTLRDGSFGILSLTKAGTGKLTLNGTVTYTGNTTVNDGTLALVDPVSLDNSGTINLSSSTGIVDVSGRSDNTLNLGNTKVQTLTGIGTVTGNLVEAANSFVRGGLGNLTVTGTATLNGGITLQLNRTNAITHSEIIATSFAIAGPLTVTNIGPAFQGGDSFVLFNHPVSGFTATNLPALSAGQYWTNTLSVNGTIAVVSTVNTNPTNITAVVVGNLLQLSWPADHTGWTLQMQTNSLSSGIRTNWVDVSGSTTVNSTNITIDPTKPTVFYRLKL